MIDIGDSSTSFANILLRPSPFSNETGKLPIGEFSPGPTAIQILKTSKVLVVGAGGLGCELLKDLALSGFIEIHVIDLDTIDVSNLNRQFLFRQADVGRGKAEVAAEFIMRRIPGCIVKPYQNKIQDHPLEFYKQFNVIISGLDNIEARRWLNSLLVSMVDYDADGDPIPTSIIPLIDGGTEGLRGQARVILPKITSCFECSIDSFPPQQGFPMCTIAETPRIPEHCIAYSFIMEWPRAFPDKKLDKDSPEDMQWVFEKASQRAATFGIEGVTYFKTIGVVKNIIPAVASTNAVISAACVCEAIKILTFCAQSLNTWYMFAGVQGLYTTSFEYGRKDDCIVCSDEASTRAMVVAGATLLKDFMRMLCDDAALQLKKPSIVGETASLYMQKPPSLEQTLRPNLDKSLVELISSGEILSVTDPMLCTGAISIRLELI